MKSKIYASAFLISIILFGCHRNTKNTALQNGQNKAVKMDDQCYMATFQKDSAFLKYKTLPTGKIMGRLVIRYGELEPLAVEKEFYHGNISGHFANDTLFADYTFTDGAHATVYRNPIALLKKNNKLFLGFGATENYLGHTWFINHSAINFDRSRFQFVASGCVD